MSTPAASSLTERIAAMLEGLSPAEQQVGQVLLADPAAFVRQPVTTLAERSGTSKPTVVRFARSLGYEGLVDLKHALAGSAPREGVAFVHRAVQEGDDTPALIKKVIDNATRTLLDYREHVALHAFERAIAALAQAAQAGRRIEFYGVGNSGIVAQDAHLKFMRLGAHSQAPTDGHVQLMAATLLQPGDCAVVISNSGHSRDLIQVAKLARRKGATVIFITASGSPLARSLPAHAQIFLAADHPEDHHLYSPMVSRLLHLTLIDILSTAVALRLPTSTRNKLKDMKRQLQSLRHA
jgi:RpiR family carbohydrate utilization transcriptional regulator